MRKYRGFSLVELMIVVAIIGILSLLALPSYKNYMIRVENTKILNDLSILDRDIRLSFITGEPSSSEYTAEKLLAISPNTTLRYKEGCFDKGYAAYRVQWTNPKEIAKVLSNTTSKISFLDITTTKKDSSCSARTAFVTMQHFFALDYEAYGVKLPRGNGYGRIRLFVGGIIDYVDPSGVNPNRRIESINNPACSVGVDLDSSGQGVKYIGSRSMYPVHCRYFSHQMSENNTWHFYLIPF